MILLQSTLHFTASKKTSNKRKQSVPSNTHLCLCSLFRPLPQGFNSLHPYSLGRLSGPDVSTYCSGQSWSTAGSVTATKKPFTIPTAVTDFCSRIMANLWFKPSLLTRREKTTRTIKKNQEKGRTGKVSWIKDTALADNHFACAKLAI